LVKINVTIPLEQEKIMLGNVVASKTRTRRRKPQRASTSTATHNTSTLSAAAAAPAAAAFAPSSTMGKKVLNNNTSSNKARGKAAGNKDKVESHKITEYFQPRRSERKTGKQIEEETTVKMEEALSSGSCEDDLIVYSEEFKGRGIRAGRSYVKNELVVEYRGDMIDYETAKLREEEYGRDHSIGSYMYFFKYKNKHWCVDATKESPFKGRLVNHSALRPNLKTKVVEMGGQHHLILIAKRSIEEGEELLYDYGDRTPATVAQNPWLVNS
ncbi:hypothetical protein PFISCL1PPCAC_8602, partial [Pristionchus fissidentatus]